MTTQVPPDELNAENDLICEKLLRWTREPGNQYTSNLPYWREHDSIRPPSFTTWAEAGLILEAFILAGIGFEIVSGKNGCHCQLFFENRMSRHDNHIPLAIRASALAYIRSLL